MGTAEGFTLAGASPGCCSPCAGVEGSSTLSSSGGALVINLFRMVLVHLGQTSTCLEIA